ncbi:replication initiation protein [Lacticaseibacillus paracasei]|uniref:replication initiation protein n=1 Tax=Lacticaseibacillus paracasei TaxID=1597 RepID=UPI0013E3F5D2|nr:replication initiation protein [Lacticaseibacillus paracasei]
MWGISCTNFSPAEIETQNRDLVKHADEFLTDPESGWEVFLEPEAIQLLSFWCRTPQQMQRFIRIILNAKNNLEKEHQALGVKINLGDDTLRTCLVSAESGRIVENRLRSLSCQIIQAIFLERNLR